MNIEKKLRFKVEDPSSERTKIFNFIYKLFLPVSLFTDAARVAECFQNVLFLLFVVCIVTGEIQGCESYKCVLFT